MYENTDEDGGSAQGAVTEFADQHSFEFLQRSSIGRIALSADNKPAIFPIDFYCDGETILNVIRAEANVPYDQMLQLEDANAAVPNCDVAVVIGANDGTNPAARRPGNPVSGMPWSYLARANRGAKKPR